METTKITNATEPSDTRDEYIFFWEIVVLTIILVMTIIGNSLILFALYLRRHCDRRHKLTRMYFYMMHLSIADLISGLLNVLPQLVWKITFRFQGGPILCKIIKYGQPLGNYLSSYVLTATAIDRYHAICYPLSYCRTTYRHSHLMVYCSWILSLLMCLPQVFLFSYQRINSELDVWDCWAYFSPYGERTYVTWFSITVFLLPFAVLVYTYLCICAEIWRNTRMVEFGQRNQMRRTNSDEANRLPLISRARIKTVKQMITVVTLYVLTSSPFIGCQLWVTWDPEASQRQFVKGCTFPILALMGSLTNAVNPWIYMGFNRDLRSTLKRYLKKIIYGGSINLNDDYGDHSSTRSTIIGTMVACALHRGKSTRDRTTKGEQLKILKPATNCK